MGHESKPEPCAELGPGEVLRRSRIWPNSAGRGESVAAARTKGYGWRPPHHSLWVAVASDVGLARLQELRPGCGCGQTRVPLALRHREERARLQWDHSGEIQCGDRFA